MSRIGVLVALLVCLIGVAACTKDGSAYTTVPELVAESTGSVANDVQVGGVFVEPPVTSDSGTMFTIAESLESDDRIDVYVGETQELETQWGSEVLTGVELVDHTVILTGDYDGRVFIADDILIQSGGGYQK